MATTALRAPRASAFTRPGAFVLLGVVAAVLLAIGSVHPATPTRAERIAYLDSVIKCPSCVDISIAQSTEQTAVALRAKVRELVDAGWSNAAIESWVTSEFGTDELLVPPSSGLDELAWILPTVVVGLAVIALASYFVRRRGRTGGGEGPDTDVEALVAAALAALDATPDRDAR